MNIELAAIYRRVSTDKQDDSLELQESRIMDYARFKRDCLTLAEGAVFSDPDTSGRIALADRLGGKFLLARLKKGDIKHLLIAKLDRLGRNARDGLGTLEFLTKQGITLHIVDLGGETITTQGHIGRLLLHIMLGVAEWEVAEIRDRTQKQMDSLFDQHKLTGNVPYGWQCLYTFPDQTIFLRDEVFPAAELATLEGAHGGRPSKVLLDKPEEQVVIRRIDNNVRNGCKREHIALTLNNEGLRTKLGKLWQIGHITSVINSRYSQRFLSLMEARISQ
jgi:DNA invertase Pin-like site-specific DNA recombinase